ncbi:MAG: hypothetical protein AB1445_13430 [Bacillota bacterium]
MTSTTGAVPGLAVQFLYYVYLPDGKHDTGGHRVRSDPRRRAFTNESLLDGLAHAVEMERPGFAVRARLPEHFQSLMLCVQATGWSKVGCAKELPETLETMAEHRKAALLESHFAKSLLVEVLKGRWIMNSQYTEKTFEDGPGQGRADYDASEVSLRA